MRMIIDIGRRCHTVANLHQIGQAAHLFESAIAFQLLGHRHDVNGTLGHVQILNRLINLLISRLIKSLGTNHFRNHRKSIFINHQRANHSPLDVGGLWLQMPIGGVYLLCSLSAPGTVSTTFYHKIF